MPKKRKLLAKDIMVKPKFVEPKAKISEIKKDLIGKENCLTVVDEKGRFLGEIHELDLLKLVIPEEKLEEEDVAGVMGAAYDPEFTGHTADMIMRKHEITVPPDTDATDVAVIMYKEDIRSVPVIKGDKIIGVIHLNQVIRKMIK